MNRLCKDCKSAGNLITSGSSVANMSQWISWFICTPAKFDGYVVLFFIVCGTHNDDWHSLAIPVKLIPPQHSTESHPTTFDVDEPLFNPLGTHPNTILLLSWKETDLPGHEDSLLADTLDGSADNLNGLSMDGMGDGYESGEDDSEEILEKLIESELSRRELEGRKAIGTPDIHIFLSCCSMSSSGLHLWQNSHQYSANYRMETP